MKPVLLYIFLFFVSTSCHANPNESPGAIKSWGTINANILNEKIQKAYKNDLKWAVKPELYIFHLFELSGLKTTSYKYSADTIELPENISINLSRDGFLDDSVHGDIHHLELKKNNNGTWEVMSIKRTMSCWRKKELIYSSGVCP